jgi:hypothetical protein
METIRFIGMLAVIVVLAPIMAPVNAYKRHRRMTHRQARMK